MNIGNIIIRIAFGLLFVWGGLEKFFEGFLGGVGLQNAAGFLKSSGWSFLGDSGTFVLAIILSSLELIAAILLLANKKLFFAFTFLAFIMLVALLTIHIPSGNWMNIMIHIALFGSLLGLGLNHFNKEKTIWQQ
ncbi:MULTISPECIES: DoxX family membrane protein [Flavobacterium]|uniref:DoxX family membrane protein n=1 Tax=Flavobacterium TaxID=237 RepID=UPI00131ABC94|nr:MULTISPECIES: DoxX family membrane protein [unclassified Flavobacterium]